MFMSLCEVTGPVDDDIWPRVNTNAPFQKSDQNNLMDADLSLATQVTPGIGIEPISVPRASSVLANALRERILAGDIPPGAELPTERELGQQGGVSRATVREALRILESDGLIETRLGRRGGSSVRAPTSLPIERSVGTFIRGGGVSMQDVFDTRAVIEPASARLAALRRTTRDLDELNRIHAELVRATRMNDVRAYVQANLDWHLQVVRASQNELLWALISGASNAIYVHSEIEGFSSPEVRNTVIRVHQRIMDAILSQDGDAAARRMQLHVGAYIAGMRELTDSAQKGPNR